jgi:hypothetical protein
MQRPLHTLGGLCTFVEAFMFSNLLEHDPLYLIYRDLIMKPLDLVEVRRSLRRS